MNKPSPAPLGAVVFGGLAGLPDVLGYRAAVKQQAEQDLEDKREQER